MAKKPLVQGVRITDISDGGRPASLLWTDRDGCRYHVLVDADTLELMNPTARLIKRPPAGVAEGSSGFFDPRHLDQEKPTNAAMIREAITVVRSLSLVESFRHDQQRAEDRRLAAVRDEQVAQADAAIRVMVQALEGSQPQLAIDLGYAGQKMNRLQLIGLRAALLAALGA